MHALTSSEQSHVGKAPEARLVRELRGLLSSGACEAGGSEPPSEARNQQKQAAVLLFKGVMNTTFLVSI
jgi:hypothetical protein